MGFLPVWPALKICDRPPPSGKGPAHASSNAVGWPETAHHEGVSRTRPPNRDFLGFCVPCGAEGISSPSLPRFVQERPPPTPPCPCGRGQTASAEWPSCPSGRLGKAGPGPLWKGPPTRRRMLSGGPKWLIVRGSSGRGPEIAIFWVSACSVVRRAFLEPGRSVSCKSGLPLLSKALSEADRPENLRCRSGSPVDKCRG